MAHTQETYVRARIDPAVKALAADKPLPEHNRDHDLTGQWKGYRERHLKPDLLLIYSKPDSHTLRIAAWVRTAISSKNNARFSKNNARFSKNNAASQ